MTSGNRRFESYDDLRLLTDAVSNPITYIDTEYRYQFSNRALEAWFGLSGDRIVGTRVRELLGEEDYAVVRPQLARALTGERLTHERAIRNRDGVERYVYTTYSPDIDALGVVHGIVVVVTDITDRRRAEEALRQQVAAFENIRYALIVTDLEGRILQINKAFIEYSGYSREEALGQSISILQRPEDRGRLIPEIMAAIAETGMWEGEVDYIRKDGTKGVSASAVVPLRDGDGGIIGLIGSNRDITDRKRAEWNLAQAYRREVALNRVSQAIRQSREPLEIQQIALGVLAETLGLDRCLSILLDRARDQVSFIAEWRRPDLPALLGEYSLTLFDIDLDDVFSAGSSLVVPDVYDGQLSETSAGVLAGMQIRALMDVPLSEDGEITAVLGVYMADAPRVWTSDEVAFVEAVASQLRAATEAARLLAQERAIATHLQTALQPSLPEVAAGLELGIHYRSALDGARVGGDFYDVFPLEHGVHALVVGDLSGKGLAAAAQVATVRNMLRFALLNAAGLAEPMEILNQTLARNGLLLGFATLFVGRFDSATKTLTYVNCGQEPGIVRRAGGSVEYLSPTGPTLGIAEGGRYEEGAVSLSSGDLLALYTDGFTEVGPNRGEPLGPQGLGRFMAETDAGMGAAAFVKGVVDCVMQCSGGVIRDDMCLLAAAVI